MYEFICGLIIGLIVGIAFMSILGDYLSKLEMRKNYFIEYNNITDEYELREYNRYRWLVIFKHSLKEAVEDRYNYIIEKEKNLPIKLKKKKNT